jgi:putative spermidine/putrescine transport system substrate-binding protein
MSENTTGTNAHRKTSAVSRRRILQSSAALAGLSAGSGSLTGFPTIWAQNIKDITLFHAGPPVAAIPKIGEQASKDLGFTIKMQATESMDLLNRFLSQSSAIDVGDVSIVFMKYLVGRNVLQAIPLGKYRDWDKVIPLFSKGVYPSGSEASTQGVAPYTVLYATGPDGQTFSKGPTEWLTGIPTITNADTLGIRPDLTGRPIKSWADLLGAEFKGKAALQDQPTVGVIDVAMALEARGDLKYGNKGNMTREEIDRTINTMMDVKKSGQFRSFWSTFDQSVNLMASGEVVIQSMWSPAVTAVKARGIPCVFQPLQEGYRGWGYTLAPMKHLAGLKLDCFYEYMNWYTSGFQGAFIARQGYYSSVPDNAKKFLTEAEWDYWYGGKPRRLLGPHG